MTRAELSRRLESMHRDGQPLPDRERIARETFFEHWPNAGLLLHHAVLQFDAACQQHVREHGGTLVSEHVRIRNGRRTRRERVRRFPPPAAASSHATARTPRTRPRGAGKPATKHATTPSRAGPDDDPDEPEPPRRRKLCGFCGEEIPADRGPKAEHCSDKHAANARQRRKRQRLVDEDTVGALLDWIMDGEGLTSEQERALHEPLAAV